MLIKRVNEKRECVLWRKGGKEEEEEEMKKRAGRLRTLIDVR
jgi:hypothetical protein